MKEGLKLPSGSDASACTAASTMTAPLAFPSYGRKKMVQELTQTQADQDLAKKQLKLQHESPESAVKHEPIRAGTLYKTRHVPRSSLSSVAGVSFSSARRPLPRGAFCCPLKSATTGQSFHHRKTSTTLLLEQSAENADRDAAFLGRPLGKVSCHMMKRFRFVICHLESIVDLARACIVTCMLHRSHSPRNVSGRWARFQPYESQSASQASPSSATSSQGSAEQRRQLVV